MARQVPQCPLCKAPALPASHVRLTLPRPPQGKGYVVVPVRADLADKIANLDPNGLWEEELSGRLEALVDEFYKTRPVELIRVPSRHH